MTKHKNHVTIIRIARNLCKNFNKRGDEYANIFVSIVTYWVALLDYCKYGAVSLSRAYSRYHRHAAFRVILVGLGLLVINVSAITGSIIYLGSTGGLGRNLTALGIFIAIGLIFIASGLIYGRFSNANR